MLPTALKAGFNQSRNLAIARTLRLQCCNAMSTSTSGRSTHQLTLLSAAPSATQLLAHYFASSLQPGDSYLLYGDVGSGKSYFSRAFIRAALQNEDLPVPSPTFLLQNIYDATTGLQIHHFDLYRLTDIKDIERLDLPSSFTKAVSLVEWPDVLLKTPTITPASHLNMRISILPTAQQEQLQRQLDIPLHIEGDDDEDDDDDSGGDWRWRRIELTAVGDRWQERLTHLQPHVQSIGAQFHCYNLLL